MDDSFELPSELTIYSVGETRDALLAWVGQQGEKSVSPLIISAKAVENVDGAGLQLLAALGSMSLTWRLAATSEVFTEGCTTLGFAHWLDGKDVVAANAGVSS
jgi:anti-anti-sigma regulatory factor